MVKIMQELQGHLKPAAYASIAEAFLTLLLSVASLLTAGVKPGQVELAAIDALSVVSLFLFIYVFSALRNLLNARFGFKEVDLHISLLIALNVVSTVLIVGAKYVPAPEDLMTGMAMFLLMGYGVVLVIFSIKLQALDSNLYGLLKTFMYLTAGSGVCLAVVFLAPVGVLLGFGSSLTLGLVFLRAWKDQQRRNEFFS